MKKYFILPALILLAGLSMANELKIKSFSQYDDCKNMEIHYEIIGRNIYLHFLDDWGIYTSGGYEESTCLLQFAIADPGALLPVKFQHAFEGRTHTTDDMTGKITASLRTPGEKDARSVLIIPADICNNISQFSETAAPMSQYSQDFIMEFRIDLELASENDFNFESSNIKIHKVILML